AAPLGARPARSGTAAGDDFPARGRLLAARRGGAADPRTALAAPGRPAEGRARRPADD
ncbi:hypothetical protein CATMIT_01923, partial [Catenibacterium mitsuokai DSM 15897]